MKLKIGNKAPDFELPSTGGKTFRLNNNTAEGKLVLYFYPKDFTPGCTAEACGFRDDFSELTKLGTRVFGISLDSIESHEKFKTEHQLPFDLLSDANGEVSRLYGAYNRLFKIANRVTFIIGHDGKILSITKNMFAPRVHIKAAKSSV
jgi:thioredoxin-dependent peroxiredoxin